MVYVQVGLRYMFRLPSRSLRFLLAYIDLILCQFLNVIGLDYYSLRAREIFYKLTKSTEKNMFEFEIRKLTAECWCITCNSNQLLGLSGLWAADSARSPLRSRSPATSRSRSVPAPFPLHRIFSSPAPTPLSRSSGFRARSAPFSAPAPVCGPIIKVCLSVYSIDLKKISYSYL